MEIHNGYLKSTGWLESKTENIAVAKGAAIPWVSYSFLYFLDSLDLQEKNLIEFGGGASTYYFVSKVKNVTTFESNSEYIDKIKTNLAIFSNLRLIDSKNCDFEIKHQENNYTSISEIDLATIKAAHAYDLQYNWANEPISYDLEVFF